MNFIRFSAFIVLVVSSSIFPDYSWVNTENPVKTVYYQGMLSSQVQASRYTGQRGFTGTTGEHVVCPKNSIDIIHDVSVGPEIDEVILDSSFRAVYSRCNNNILATSLYYLWYRMLYLKAYGSKTWYGIQVTNSDGKMLSETLSGHAVEFSKINVGQAGDIESHSRKVDACDGQKILFGVSRGTATTFVAHATHSYKDVKLVVLEGAIDSVPNVLKTYKLGNWYTKALQTFGSYNPEERSPLDVVNEFSKDTPVAFITSEKDTEVPAANTQNLAQALANANHDGVYLCKLKNSSHNGYVMENEEDAQEYRKFIHTLYKSLNLEYIDEYATGNIDDYKVSAQN